MVGKVQEYSKIENLGDVTPHLQVFAECDTTEGLLEV